MAMPSPARPAAVSRGALVFLLALPLHGQEPALKPDWEGFVGLSLVWADYKPAFPVAGAPDSRTTAGFALYGGGRWRRTWGFEIDQTFYGDFTVIAGGVPEDRDVCTTSLTGMAWLPLGSASAYGRAGVAYWTATRGEGYVFLKDSGETTTSGFTPHLGVGVEAPLGKQWLLRLDGSLFPRVLSHRLVRVSAGAAWRF
ncbi:outer membrane beta-barrel protein [Geothrix sp. SG200]|uniref:outer membrane beta-barrel protein n=1 Tax=Geothrix sp. SG200 TaxID=2922865 RepID=UPI001FACD7E3|nr:outer membrane beta-barrel protein [Geothrix sp. SG200]